MKNQTLYVLLLVYITFTTSCSNDNDIKPTVENPKSVTDCELRTDPEFKGICLDGATSVSLNEVMTYASKSTANFSEILWTIESGSIEILNIENSFVNGFNKSIATIKFNSDFSGGSLKVIASNASGASAGIYNYRIELENQ
jgi:hypothetical protein